MEFLRCGRAFSGLAGGPNLKAALLGKTARYAPDRTVDTLHIKLDLKIDFDRRSTAGYCETTVRAFRGGVDKMEFDAVGLIVSRVSSGGKTLRHSLGDGKLKIFFRKALAENQEETLRVDYRVVNPKAGLHFVYPGPHNPKNPVQVWSQSQPEDARYWYPCHDSPHEKATSEARVAVPKGFRLVSNGVLHETSHSADKKWTTYHWKMAHPHSIYLISIAAGRFSEIVEHWDSVPVTYYCEKGRESEARTGFAKTPAVIDYFSKMTGVRYPYEKYAQVAVAEYPGGMEHTTCTTQTDAILIDKRAALDNDLDLLVAHELAHQWFGDLVTCRDWSHAWLNEGFATYFEVLFTGHDKGQDEADFELLQNARVYFDEDAKRYRRPIVCNNFKFPWILFDRHTYEKGGWVLHMLRSELGDELWWKTIRHYLQKHRDQSVDTINLIEAIEECTGRNMKPFFDQWVFKSGYPNFRVQYQWDAKSRKAQLWVLQTQDVNEESPLFQVPVKIRFSGRGWTKDFTERVFKKEHRFSFTLPGEPLNTEFDPDHQLLKKLTFNKPHAFWKHQMTQARSSSSRAEAAAQVGRWGDEEAVQLLVKAVAREKFWGTACQMIRSLGAIKSEAAFQSLKKLLSVKHPKLRRVAVESLGTFSRPEVGPLLAKFARKDPSINVEAQASRSLGELRDKKYKPLLLKNMKKQSYRDAISAGAVAGLGATRDPGVLEVLRKSCQQPNGFYLRIQALRSLADFAPLSRKVIPWICEIASDPDERINLTAIAVLGQLEDERALPTLEKARKSDNSRIKTYAEEAIAKIRAGVEPKN